MANERSQPKRLAHCGLRLDDVRENEHGGPQMTVGSIRPEVLALRDFFKEEATSLRIPSIQRQFVWDAEDIKELVDSIINGYPIGAVIIWEPRSRFPSAPS